jgi:hypothetical protein
MASRIPVKQSQLKQTNLKKFFSGESGAF